MPKNGAREILVKNLKYRFLDLWPVGAGAELGGSVFLTSSPRGFGPADPRHFSTSSGVQLRMVKEERSVYSLPWSEVHFPEQIQATESDETQPKPHFLHSLYKH